MRPTLQIVRSTRVAMAPEGAIRMLFSVVDVFPRGCVVLLNGYPGVGKLSVAKILVAKLKSQHGCSVRLFGK
jgi:adenylylsulfate kinase-like enzyme